MRSDHLVPAVRGLLARSVECYRDVPEVGDSLRRQLDRMDEPLRVAITGRVKAGKSTLLNALVGQEIAATGSAECTRAVTWYRDGPVPRVTLCPRDGLPRQLPVDLRDGALAVDLGGTAPADVERVVVDWPSQHLRRTTLIDTPGTGSASAEVSARTTAFLAPGDEPTEADAVIYLMRHVHAADVRFLESFHDRTVARATAVNTVAVLSRADEIGAGRVDAMVSARRIARRCAADERLRGACQTVVPVAGLLARTARTLRQDEFTALAALAGRPRPDVEASLLSADRFLGREDTGGVPARALLDRFGLFGLKLALVLVRQGFADPTRLSAELVRRSGLEELQRVLAVQFGERSHLLKARSGLLALDLVLRGRPRPGTSELLGEVERVLAGAHAFTELRLLNALRAGALRLPEEVGDEAERLLGGSGSTSAARLGLEPGADPKAQRAAALDALARWRRSAENPLSTRAAGQAAQVVVRSCEGVLAEVGDGASDAAPAR